MNISPNYNIPLEEWEHDKNHIHVLFKVRSNSELSKFINSYKNFFNGRGLLKFISKKDNYQIYTTNNQKGSLSCSKARLKVAKLHKKIANQRNDSLHKLAKSISEVSWYQFRLMLEYKSKWYSRELIMADKHFANSQLCSVCGYKNSGVKNLALMQWKCPN